MCDQCKPIDAQLQRYRSLKALTTDHLARDAIDKLSEGLEAQKKALHLDEPPLRS